MRFLVLAAALTLFSGCASQDWPAPDRPVHYGAVARSDLVLITEGDTAADIFRKFGGPVGDIPLPWLAYDCFGEEGKSLVFYFDIGAGRRLRPSDRLVSVVLFTRGAKDAGTVLWKRSGIKGPNQALLPTSMAVMPPASHEARQP
jgi:hypothetical protein